MRFVARVTSATGDTGNKRVPLSRLTILCNEGPLLLPLVLLLLLLLLPPLVLLLLQHRWNWQVNSGRPALQ